MLEVALAELPVQTAGDAAADSDAALEYLFTQGQEIGRTLAGRFGADHAALFEIAVKSNILLVIYQPGAPTAEAIAAAIAQAGPRAKLPAELWRPLLDTLKSGADMSAVRKAVFRLHAETDKYLEVPAAP
jgi:hypothetical protein